MKNFAAAFALLLATTAVGQAQLGLYGGFSTSTLKLANSGRYNGGTFGVYYDASHHPFVNFGVDARLTAVSNTTNNFSSTYASVLFGPRIAFHLRAFPLRPYAEILVGLEHTKAGQGFASNDGSGVAAGAAAGADFSILPHVDWRVIDYSYLRVQGPNTYQQTLTTGIVVRFH